MVRADIANVAQRILPDGVRPNKEQIAEIEKAIEATAVNVSNDATYVDLLGAKLKNEDDAVKKLQTASEPNKPKAKAKAKGK
ncbi:MAG: hypothetical protein CMC15_14680 [Flavobacteriaceae bacterium]|nr:hypothetical protein [Flavobacteriaceae bacterium]